MNELDDRRIGVYFRERHEVFLSSVTPGLATSPSLSPVE